MSDRLQKSPVVTQLSARSELCLRGNCVRGLRTRGSKGTLKSLRDSLIHQPGVPNVKQAMIRFLKGEEGLTVVEYAIAGSLVGLAVVLAFTDLGAAVEARIREIIAAIS